MLTAVGANRAGARETQSSCLNPPAHLRHALNRAGPAGSPVGDLDQPSASPRTRACGWGVKAARSSGIPAAQKLWHVSKAHLLKLFQEGFRWRAGVLPPTLAAP